jgi:hypothetical protein
MERDSTQLNRLLERLREQEDGQQEGDGAEIEDGADAEVEAGAEGLPEEQEQELLEGVVTEPGEGAGGL